MRKGRKGLTSQEKTVLKLMACLYACLFLGICVFLRLLIFFVPDMQGSFDILHIPVVEHLKNVWVISSDDNGMVAFVEGERKEYEWTSFADRPGENVEFVADIKIVDGKVKTVHKKAEIISGKVIRYDGQSVEIEGHGSIPLSQEYKGYRLYKELEMCTVKELPFGYSFADFCVEDGEICALLLVREDVMSNIRVLLKQEQSGGIFHDWIKVSCDADINILVNGQVVETCPRDATISFDGNDKDKQTMQEIGRIQIVPATLSARMNVKSASAEEGRKYRGTIELFFAEEGIVVVNELPLEEYLYSVVPSEMPASYPADALQAQAICARTYAYTHLLRAGYPAYGAHVDDSTSYQVYNHIQEQESTTEAVRATYGKILFGPDNSPASTFYYSTSCGVGADTNVWKTEEAKTITYIKSDVLNPDRQKNDTMTAGTGAIENSLNLLNEDFETYITSVNEEDFEANEPWYRWTYEVKGIEAKEMFRRLQTRYHANNKLVLTWNKGRNEYESKNLKEFRTISNLWVEKRGPGGYADELIIETDKGKFKLISEHNIRYVLNDGKAKVILQNGKEVESKNLLPSGFFAIEPSFKSKQLTGYRLLGGGFGHGVGMSQNGAKNMALKGYTVSDIISFFYTNCEVKNIYS